MLPRKCHSESLYTRLSNIILRFNTLMSAKMHDKCVRWWSTRFQITVCRIAISNMSILWCHNERNSVSNHRRLRLFTQPLVQTQVKEKHQSSAALAFLRGIHRWPVNSPHKGPVTRKMFPFDDVITCLPNYTSLINCASLVTVFGQASFVINLTPRVLS